MTEILLKDALDRYRHTVSILKKGYAQEVYRINHLCQSFLGTMPVHAITSKDIATYRDQRLTTINIRTKKPISNATVRLEMSLLSNFFDISRIEWGYCDGNPVANVRKPKPAPGRERRLTAREERQILRYCHNHPNPEIGAIFSFALETAMRQGEILNMRWEFVNLKAQIVRLPETKNGTTRDVPLSLKARDILIGMGPKGSGKVFSFTSSGFKSSWRFMVKRLGIEDLHFHDCRHEATSRLFELGSLEMMEIAAITGHKSLSMLKRYTHLRAQKLVRKLEGQKNRAKAAVISHLIPYPALLSVDQGAVSVRILDFDNLEAQGRDIPSAMNSARNLLMRTILTKIKESEAIPPPDHFLDLVPEDRIVLLDPLAPDTLLQNYRESSNNFMAA